MYTLQLYFSFFKCKIFYLQACIILASRLPKLEDCKLDRKHEILYSILFFKSYFYLLFQTQLKQAGTGRSRRQI